MAAWFEDETLWEVTYPVTFPPERLTLGEREVDQVLRMVGDRPRAVLDLGCGPGRHAVPLARRGFAVTGVDGSAFLLGRARERAATAGVGVELVHEDMRRFVRPAAFDLALSLFTSFGYFDDRGEDLAVLQRVHESLRPGGALVMDLMGKEPLARWFQPTRSRRLPDGSLLVERATVLEGWSRVRTEWLLVRDGAARSFEFTINLYSGQELASLLAEAGFETVRLHGGLDGSPYAADAARLVTVARKAVH